MKMLGYVLGGVLAALAILAYLLVGAFFVFLLAAAVTDLAPEPSFGAAFRTFVLGLFTVGWALIPLRAAE
ncbi:hypothetical protein [Micromonospora sediminicola]|uniref:hypothetical protein n=1 Tax=Micromonospora sediminicola TaxID=946078 RepID=UPI00378DEF08